MKRFFKLDENHTTVKTEVLAGITTFMTMAYILAVNPSILSATGMDKNALFTATALSALVATLVMALVARLPFALAPGMGLNAFFAFTVVLGMGYSWRHRQQRCCIGWFGRYGITERFNRLIRRIAHRNSAGFKSQRRFIDWNLRGYHRRDSIWSHPSA